MTQLTEQQKAKIQELQAAAWAAISAWISSVECKSDIDAINESNRRCLVQEANKHKRIIDKYIDSLPE
jgi:hypothetical protein